jgi:hypothetical protein
MPADHLDDHVISDLIDGVPPDGATAGHLASCGPCQARVARVTEAVRLVATPVPPLGADVADRLVRRAVVAPVVPIDVAARRRRLLRATPPPWVVAAVAALALVVGIPALLRSDGFGQGTEMGESVAAGGGDSRAGISDAAAPAGGPAPGATGEHLGAVDTEDAVVAGLRSRLDVPPSPQSESQLVARPAAGAAASSKRADSSNFSGGGGATERDAGGAGDEGGPTAPACLDSATAVVPGGTLIYLAPATWRGQDALVFVFALAEPPPEGPRRQAVVTSVQGCGVVAAPRF